MSAYTSYNLADTLGGTTVGFSFALTLGGIALQQAVQYFSRFPRDSIYLKAIVAALTVLNLFHSATVSHVTYFWNVIKWGSIEGLDIAPVSYGLTTISCAIITSIVQTFYAYRIHVLAKSYLFPILITVLSVVQFCFAIYVAAYTISHPHQSKFHRILWQTYTYLITAVVNDIIISVVLIYCLHRSKGLSTHINSFMTVFSIITFQTNGLTAVVALLVVILFGTIQNGWNVGLYMTVAKLYIISFLTSVNARPAEPTGVHRRSVVTTYSHPGVLYPDLRSQGQHTTHSLTSHSGDNLASPVKVERDNFASGVYIERSVIIDVDRTQTHQVPDLRQSRTSYTDYSEKKPRSPPPIHYA